MKRIVPFLTSALVLTALTAPALSFNISASLYAALSDAVEASRTHRDLNALSADFAISKFDKTIVESFGTAWMRAGDGSLPSESVVLILRMYDGSYRARDLGSTNEHKQFTFRWHPATIAIVHTHPNSSDPKPQYDDRAVADKFHVPVFTITNRGMYVYDPGTKKLSRVMRDLDWLDASRWTKAVLARH